MPSSRGTRDPGALGSGERQAFEQLSGARRQHSLGQLSAQLLGILGTAGDGIPDELRAVGLRHQSLATSAGRRPRAWRRRRSATGNCRRGAARTRARHSPPYAPPDRRAPAPPRGRLESSARHSMPMTPWPTAGSETLGSSKQPIRASSPSRVRPAAASTTASSSPSSRRLSRVSTLPRNGMMSRSGREARSCARRRMLEVPSRAPRGSSPRLGAPRVISASRGSARDSIAPSVIPAGRSAGMSFIE